MKAIEDAFASDVFRRVVLPGIVLSAGIHPLISQRLSTIYQLYGIGAGTLLAAEVIVFGLVTSSSTQWIYYVYEGFRLRWLTAVAGYLTQAKLRRRQNRSRQIRKGRDFDDLSLAEQLEVTTIYEYLCDFPLRRFASGTKEHFAERPTRLGNIIATYELYAESRYDIDGTFFWYHILYLAPDATRKAFDDRYSFAESLVLTSFAGAVVAGLHGLILLAFAIGSISKFFVFFRLPLNPAISWILLSFGFAVWLLFYKTALPAHRGAGDSFRAIVDLTWPKFQEWAAKTDPSPAKDKRKQISSLADYLKDLA